MSGDRSSPRRDRDGRRRELADELRYRVDLEAIVEQADGRADAGAEQDRMSRPPSDGLSSSTGTATATNMAMPPPNGIGLVCSRRAELR